MFWSGPDPGIGHPHRTVGPSWRWLRPATVRTAAEMGCVARRFGLRAPAFQGVTQGGQLIGPPVAAGAGPERHAPNDHGPEPGTPTVHADPRRRAGRPQITQRGSHCATPSHSRAPPGRNPGVLALRARRVTPRQKGTVTAPRSWTSGRRHRAGSRRVHRGRRAGCPGPGRRWAAGRGSGCVRGGSRRAARRAFPSRGARPGLARLTLLLNAGPMGYSPGRRSFCAATLPHGEAPPWQRHTVTDCNVRYVYPGAGHP